MENRTSVPAPVPNPTPKKGHDYQPPETTDDPKRDDRAAEPRPPGDFDPTGRPPGSGDARR
jgi:hypothetical protein